GGEDLFERQPVLDLRREGVPGQAGLRPQRAAREVSRIVAGTRRMNSWGLLVVNSFAYGGVLFLLSAGFSLIFGLMRIPNLMHGSFFMLGAYLGVTLLGHGINFWVAALASGAAMAVIGGLIERFLLRRLAGQQLPQVLLTLGFSFIIADICLM